MNLEKTVERYAQTNMASTRPPAPANSLTDDMLAIISEGGEPIFATTDGEVSYKGKLQSDAEKTRQLSEGLERLRLEEATEELRAAGMLPCTLREIIATKYPPPDWIVKDLIAAKGATSRGFKGDLIAPPKTGKTLVGLGLFACASAGREWLGLEIPRPFKCLYLDLELREDFNRERLEKIAVGMGANLDNLAVKCIADPYNIRNRFDRNGKRIEGIGHEDALITWIRGMGFEFVALDSQYKLLIEGEDENSGEGMAGIMHLKDRIITEAGATLLGVHHDNKSGGEGKAAWQRGSGSGFLGRDYDYRITLDEHADGVAGHEVLGFSSRYRIPPEDRTIIRDNDTLTFSVAHDILPQRKGEKPQLKTAAEQTDYYRKAAEEGVRAIFRERAEAVEARAEREGRDPTPVEYLWRGTEDFKLEIGKRANLKGKTLETQYKRLLEAGIVTWNAEIISKDGKLQNTSTLYHGLPVDIEEYRKGFDLDPHGVGPLSYRGGDPRRPLKA